MRRRGQAVLVVFGITMVTLILVLASYYLVKIFTENNSNIQYVGTELTSFNTYSESMDLALKGFISTDTAVSGSNLSLTCKYTEVPFSANISRNPCDIRYVYLSKIYDDVIKELSYKSSPDFGTRVGVVEGRTIVSGKPIVRNDLNALVFPVNATNNSVSLIVISRENGTRFYFPNITNYDVGDYQVCYNTKTMSVRVAENCTKKEKDVAPFFTLRNEHELVFTVPLRPIMVYDALLYAYAGWKDVYNKKVGGKTIVVPVDFGNALWHFDPMSKILPNKLFDGKWHDVTGKFDEVDENVYTAYNSTEFETGLINGYVSEDTLKATDNSENRLNFFFDLLFFPDFNYVKSDKSKVTLFYSDMGDQDITPNKVMFISPTKSSRYYLAKASLYNFDSFDKYFALLKNISEFKLDTDISFYSLVGVYNFIYSSTSSYFNNDYSLNTTRFFKQLALDSVYDRGLPYAFAINPDKYSDVTYTMSLVWRGDKTFFNWSDYFKNNIKDQPFYVKAVSGNRVYIYKDKAHDVFKGNDNYITVKMLMADYFWFPIVFFDKDYSYQFSDSNFPKVRGSQMFSQTNVLGVGLNGGDSVAKVLGNDYQKYVGGVEDWSNILLSKPEFRDVKFRMYDASVDYYVTYNLSKVKAVIDLENAGGNGDDTGIPDGTCNCTVTVGNNTTTVTCPKFKNPPFIGGGGKGRFNMPYSDINGGVHTAHYTVKSTYTIDTRKNKIFVSIGHGDTWTGLDPNGGWQKKSLVEDGYFSGYLFVDVNGWGWTGAGCNRSDIPSSVSIEIGKVYVGVPQYYDVDAVLSFKLDFNITGNLYGVDELALINMLDNIVSQHTPLNSFEAVNKTIFLWMNGRLYPLGDVAVDYIQDVLGNNQNSQDIVNSMLPIYVPPEFIFATGVYQYVPFHLVIRGLPVVFVYKFKYGFPGRLPGSVKPYAEHGSISSDSLNWFDVTYFISNSTWANNIEDNKKAILKEAVKTISSIRNADSPFVFLEPTSSGGDYTPITVEGFKWPFVSVRVHFREVGKLPYLG